MSLVGYARTSTVEQIAGLESQITELETMGCLRVFNEQVSSVAEREQLNNALDYLREGDTLVVTKLDRLARSMADLMKITKQLKENNIELRILDMNLDTSTPQGTLMLNVFGSVAQFEREIMLERQREGIAKAKQEGKYKGRKPISDTVISEVKNRIAQGEKQQKVCMDMGIGKTKFYEIKKQIEEAI